jgi:hypothetical protein
MFIEYLNSKTIQIQFCSTPQYIYLQLLCCNFLCSWIIGDIISIEVLINLIQEFLVADSTIVFNVVFIENRFLFFWR